MASDTQQSDEDLIRAIRFTIASESKATPLNTQFAEPNRQQLPIAVLEDSVDSELIYDAGFIRLLGGLVPDEEYQSPQGAKKEVKEFISKVKWLTRRLP